MTRCGRAGAAWSAAAVLMAGCVGTWDGGTLGAPSEPELIVDGAVAWPTVSPDGRHLAFEVATDAGTDIRVMELGEAVSTTLLGGAANDQRPAWSPSGDSLAFVSDRDGSVGIWIAGADGSGARRVYDSGRLSVSRPDWSPDGTTLAFSRLDGSGQGNVSWGRATIHTVSVADGRVREHTTGGDEWWPAWTRDGTALVYYIGKYDELETVDVRSDSVRVLWNGRMVGWRPDGSPTRDEVAFISDMDSQGLWTAGLQDDAEPVALVRSGRPDQPSYLPDGSGLVFTMDTATAHVVRLALPTGTQDTLVAGGHTPRPLAGGGYAYLPAGPRGDRVVVVDGVPEDTVTLPIGPIADFDLSPDGSRIAATAPTPGNARHDLYVLDLDDLEPTKLTDAGDVFLFSWCRDSESFVVSSSTDKRANLRRKLWRVDAGAGGLEEIDVGTFEAGLWPSDCGGTPDDLVFELRQGSSGMYAARRTAVGYRAESLGTGSVGRWSPDQTRVAFIDWRNGQADIFLRAEDGTVERMTDDQSVESNVRWAHDGSALLFDRVTPSRGIWLIRF